MRGVATRGWSMALALVVTLAGGALPTTALAPPVTQAEPGLRVATRVMKHLAIDGNRRKSVRPRPGLPIDLGKDGRLTVLLLGSDWRPGGGGERLDTVMVVTIDPTSGVAAAVSIPRDMSGIPLAGGGNSGSMRVNSIYYIRYRKASLGHSAIDRRALTRFKRDIAAFLGTEIDYWAFVRFGSFSSVVNKLGGIFVDVREAVLDSRYHHGPSFGVWFPKASRYKLKGNPQCKPRPRKCRSALVYARSRKGTMGSRFNDDYRRSERQQQIVLAGVKRALEDHGSGMALLGLLGGVRKYLVTDMPTTPEAAAQLFDILSGVRVPAKNMKVLTPGTWASTGPAFTIRPNVSAIRRWVKQTFTKVRQRARE
jgi:LCP family protein required for cell wall assembly